MTAGCGCACSSGGFCGGCGHAGCGGRRAVVSPAPVTLPQLGASLRNPEEIRDWLSRHGNEDPEAAHEFVDELLLSTLRTIRNGHPNPAALAELVLTITDAHFPRWTA